jgi:glycosyltransferase involved in cell wall biosynthesis
MIFVNDGSTDNSSEIAGSFAAKDSRIKIYSKENGGLNSARNYGLELISDESEYVIFSDADDVLHKDFLFSLYNVLKNDSQSGAAYCNYTLIDFSGKRLMKDNDCNRYVPTKYWIRALDPNENYTPFNSIFSWTPMVEPMTLMKKDMLNKYGSWDEINFPKGDTYGESIPLFGEIALNHKIIFVNKNLYFYRKHEGQITGAVRKMKNIQKKIDRIWEDKVLANPEYKLKIKQAIIFRDYRLPLPFYFKGSFRHDLRKRPLIAFKNLISKSVLYLYSLRF